jgi:glyoxylase-like metal-dependent hydrolase (beta-lactamase superfamily II)
MSRAALTASLLLAAWPGVAQPLERWDPGAADCSHHGAPPIELHRIDDRTVILREGLCTTAEAPFMYLLIGRDRALLVDTGDVADPALAPIGRTVLDLLPATGGIRLPLLVAHTHSHLDHRAGDVQFEGLPGVEVVPHELDGLRARLGLSSWPEGAGLIELGDRLVDVLPAPGHSHTDLVFYDRTDRLVLSGDVLMPGRLLLSDATAAVESARRLAAYFEGRPVSLVLGGHVEEDETGALYAWHATYHPRERPLPLTKAQLLALPGLLSGFSGLWMEKDGQVVIHQGRLLGLAGSLVAVLLAAGGWLLWRRLRRPGGWLRVSTRPSPASRAIE